MIVRYIVKFGEKVPEEALAKKGELALNISEFFFDTIQGEGTYLGTPAAFLRLAGCPVNCEFCDTAKVWKTSQRIRVDWLIERMEEMGLVDRFRVYGAAYHLVVTGGSPLLQQKNLIKFFYQLFDRFRRDERPFVELENECSIVPDNRLLDIVDIWNCSPKLSNSNVPVEKRYVPEAMKALHFENCYYKFVVQGESDVEEIYKKYINPGYVDPLQVTLMPMGATREEYESNREKVVSLAIDHGFRYSPREHIAIWDQKTGI